MHTHHTRYVRALAACLCASLLLGPLAAPAAADVETQIKLDIGQPNIWSLSQAHYLLALLRDKSHGLNVDTPKLDPNAVDGARIDILRTMLGIDAQFSAPQGLQNSVAQQQFNADFARKQAAIARIDELSRERLNVVREMSRLDSELAKLPPAPEEDEEGDPQVERNRAELTRLRDAQKQLNDALQAEVTTLTPIAASTTSLSNLQTGAPFGAGTGFPNLANDFPNVKDLVDKLLGNTAQPKVNASQALDNYINMQYEKLAKELTLLRDEVGPSERLVFLELPSSLYTVPKRDDNIMVQLEWDVDDYVGKCPEKDESNAPAAAPSKAEKLLERNRAWALKLDRAAAGKTADELDDEEPEREDSATPTEQHPPLTSDAIDAYLAMRSDAKLSQARELDKYDRYKAVYSALTRLDAISQQKPDDRLTASGQEARSAARAKAQKAHEFLAELKKVEGGEEIVTLLKRYAQLESTDTGRQSLAEARKLQRFLHRYPSLRDAGLVDVSEEGGRTLDTRTNELCTDKAKAAKFRVVDIIPRQSALNVNDVHATQKGFALAAQFLSLFGFGGKVSYERQRTHYEQFINQDVFASGFGKGLSRFGWTMGPLPGTKRLAPGPRTTFAVIAIPKEVQRLTLRARGKAFKRTKDPNVEGDTKPLTGTDGKTFKLMIPNEETQGFWVTNLNYTPVRTGQRVAVVIGGLYFSPLTGVMVDGLPLKRAIALAKHESETITNANDTSSPGEYEYINSTQIVASFTRNTAGTPLITLITPEKTAALNYFRDLTINFRGPDSLLNRSRSEPMFIDAFGLTRLEIDGDPRGYGPVDVLLVGTGLRRRAEISVNGLRIPDDDVELLNTGAYAFRIADPRAPELYNKPWTVTYRVGQEVGSVVYDMNTDGMRADAPTIDSIENPSNGKAEGLGGGGYTVTIRGQNLQNVTHVTFGPARSIRLRSTPHPNVLLVKVPKGKEGGVQVLLEGFANGKPVSNILDFITPGKAIFKYVPKPKPEGQQQQSGGAQSGGARRRRR